jgi:ribose transport system substrate-binding protein
MTHDDDDFRDQRDDPLSRRQGLKYMAWTGAGVLWTVSGGGPRTVALLGRAEAAGAMAQAKSTIPIIVKNKTSFYWQLVLAGARKAGHDLGVDVVELGAQSETDIDAQINLLESGLASKPAAIVIAPAQFAALANPIDKAAKTVKIVGIDSEVGSTALTSLLKTDNVQAGAMAADILAASIQRTYADAEGDVALITASPGVPAFDQRAKGFRERIAAQYGALEIVAETVGDGRTATGAAVMTDLRGAHPQLRGVFASDVSMVQGAAAAFATHGVKNTTGDIINLVGFDWNDAVLKSLQAGTVAALVVQDPFRMGYDGIKTALAASRGEPVPKIVDIGATLITKANLGSARSQELLNRKI